MDIAAEIANLVAQIPPGRVSTYADIANAIGDVRAATAVFRILREASPQGAHRVVRASGEPTTGGSSRLRREGLAVSRGRVEDLAGVRWTEFNGPRTLARLRDEQRRLAEKVETADRVNDPTMIAGFDVSYDDNAAAAAVVVMDAAGERVLEEATVRMAIDFPYIPGYLSYREFPAIAACYRRLTSAPDLLMIDGHGLLHPARFGIACHVGVALDRPSVGVAKSLLVGTMGPPPRRAGDWTEVRIDGEAMGAALRSGRSRRLVYVSVGHAISLPTALRITKRLCKTRIPEPLRRADLLAKEKKRKWKKKR